MITNIITVLAIIGVIFNIRKSAVSFYIWTVTNGFWLVHNYRIGEYQQAFLYFVFMVLSIVGAVKWLRSATEKDD